MVTRLQQSPGLYDVSAIITFFGGRTVLRDQLEMYGIVRLTPHAIKKWALRGLPAARRDDLIALAKKQRRQFKLEKFTIKKKAA